MRGYTIIVCCNLLLLSALCTALSDVFLTASNILNILTASSTIGILAIGAAFVIGSGGIDLSVGSLMGLSATVAALVFSDSGYVFAEVVTVCLLTGALCGSVSGFLVGRVRLPAFIVTLGMLSLARGLALVIADGRPIYGLPDSVLFVGQGRVGSIPVPVLVFLVTGIASYLLIHRTKFGRHCLAIGDNEVAARNAGILTARKKIQLYAFSGLLAALSGLLSMGRINAADPNSGIMYELTAITAAIIGGTSLSGGRTSVIGAVLGALLMGVLQNGLTLINVPAYYQQVAIGLVLIVAVAAAQWRRRDAFGD